MPGKLLPASRILWRSDPYEGHPPFEMHTQGTVPTHKMHNLDTAPMYKMHSIATSMFYDNLLLALIWFACLLKLNDSSLYPFFAKLKPQLSSAVFPLLLHPPPPPYLENSLTKNKLSLAACRPSRGVDGGGWG